jgi:hypothetical protein
MSAMDTRSEPPLQMTHYVSDAYVLSLRCQYDECVNIPVYRRQWLTGHVQLDASDEEDVEDQAGGGRRRSRCIESFCSVDGQ